MAEGGVCLGAEATWLTLNPGFHFHAVIYWFGKAGGGMMSEEEGGSGCLVNELYCTYSTLENWNWNAIHCHSLCA